MNGQKQNVANSKLPSRQEVGFAITEVYDLIRCEYAPIGSDALLLVGLAGAYLLGKKKKKQENFAKFLPWLDSAYNKSIIN